MEALVRPGFGDAVDISIGTYHVISTANSGFEWSILIKDGYWHVYTGEASRNTGLPAYAGDLQHVVAVFIPGTGIKFSVNGIEQQVLIPHIGYSSDDNDVVFDKETIYDYFKVLLTMNKQI